MYRFLLVIFLCAFMYADDFVMSYGYETNYATALQKAKEQKKDLVVVLISDYCPWCDKLKDEVLALEYTNEILDEHYIKLMLNTTYDKYPSRLDRYIVPTVHFVKFEDESIIETVIGFNAYYRFFEIIEEKAVK